ncbi:MAG: hypothetical protein WC216_02715 [Gallionella sp.]|jgi:hypothetical protein
MCFSPHASFAAAAVLTLIGVVTLGKPRVKGEWLLAALPLIFAAQQLTEGILWLILRGHLAFAALLSGLIYLHFTGYFRHRHNESAAGDNRCIP